MARKGFKIDTSTVRRNLGSYGTNAINVARTGMQVKIANDENRAKSNRKWKDRTGQARASITGSVEYDDNKITGALAIGADHGVFLEKANGGNYAIVWPTLLENQRELIEIGRIALTSSRI